MAADLTARVERFRADWAPARVAIQEGTLICDTCKGPFATRFLTAFDGGYRGTGGRVKAMEPEATTCPDCRG